MPTAMTSSATIWYAWAGTTATSGSTTAIWNHWTTNTSTSATGNGLNVIWTGWNQPASVYVPIPPPVVSPEEQERRRQAEAARMAVWQEQERIRKEQQAEADKRAERLLHSQLSGRQRRQYRRDKSFIVTGKDGHTYKIERAWSGHVFRLDSRNRKIERFCIHPEISVPLPDNQLAAKLMLEADPEQFRRIANVTQLVA